MFLLPNNSAIRLPVLIQPFTKFIEWRSGQQGAIRLSMGLHAEALVKKNKKIVSCGACMRKWLQVVSARRREAT
jgi:hypothetical protein